MLVFIHSKDHSIGEVTRYFWREYQKVEIYIFIYYFALKILKKMIWTYKVNFRADY